MLKIVKTTAFLLISLLIPACAKSVTVTPHAHQATVLIQNLLDEKNIPGIAVSISKNGRTIYTRGFGYADLEQAIPVDPAKSKFRIGSVSKPLTVFALAKLIDQNKINLDTPIQAYVPTFPVKPQGPITPQLLAGHLAGIRHYKGDEFLSLKNYPTVNSGLVIFQDDPLLHSPGSKYAYSSYGYNLLSAAIESAANEPFLLHIQRVVFDALDMHNTTADHIAPIIPYRTRYYIQQEGQTLNAPPVDNSYKWAGGGFLSTSQDLLKFANAHFSTQHLSQKTINLIWDSQRTTAGQLTHYGIGWQTHLDSPTHRYVAHTGGSVGGTTVLRIYPDQQLVIAIICNLSSASLGEITKQLAAVYLED